jgi:hypothetical protein
MGEHEGGFRELTDAARAGGDVLQDAPAADEEGEAAFAGVGQGGQAPRGEGVQCAEGMDGRIDA